MTASNQEPIIIRTERGLTITGTRTSLYDVIDLLKAHYPPKLIRDTFNLTDAQINAALSYIEANQVQIEAEYQEVLQTREEIRQYWEDRNREPLPELQQCRVSLGRKRFGQSLRNRKRDEVPHKSNDFLG